MIETERLILRPFTEHDAADVFAYLEKPTVNCFASLALPDLEAAKAEMKNRMQNPDLHLAIVLKAENKVIGEVTAEAEQDPHSPETPADTFSPFWLLNNAYQGKGLAYEAAVAFFDYLFNEKGARRIYAYAEDDNHASQALCEKLGMRKEDVFLEFISFVSNPDGTPRYENTVQYAMLKKEWRK